MAISGVESDRLLMNGAGFRAKLSFMATMSRPDSGWGDTTIALGDD